MAASAGASAVVGDLHARILDDTILTDTPRNAPCVSRTPEERQRSAGGG